MSHDSGFRKQSKRPTAKPKRDRPSRRSIEFEQRRKEHRAKSSR